jgi:undecaprenyl-diphosphatase
MPRAAWVLAGALVVLSAAVAAGWLTPIDAGVTNAMVAVRSPFQTDVASSFTALGSAPVVTIVALLATLYCVAAGRPRFALALLWTPLAFLLNEVAKSLMRHPRPTEAIVALPQSFGFPSGHSAAASALFLTLALLATGAERRSGPRRLLIGAALLVAVLVAWSRVYLGVHYFSDVVGGLLLGSAGAVAATTVVRRTDMPSR